MPSSNRKIAVLVSGGLDSAILLHQCLKKYSSVQPIYIRSGHIWEEAELAGLKRFLDAIHRKTGALPVPFFPLVCLSLPADDLYTSHWSLTGKRIPGERSRDEAVYLPGKNLLMISKAAVFCSLAKIPNLALGPLKSNPFPDARASFFKSMERVCSAALDFKFRIHTPFLKLSKREVMKLGCHLPLELTFSCLSPRKVSPHKGTVPQTGDCPLFHCGRCNKCAERRRAFRESEIKDRTRYAR